METLIILTYTALCVAIFKIFRIPKNKWTIPTAALGGIIILATLVLVMNYNHPFTRLVRQTYVVTPIVSEVRARVQEVNATPNTLVKAGDPLITLDPTRYEERVTQASAELSDALRGTEGRVASVTEAEAALAAAVARRDQAQRTLNRMLGASSAFSQQRIDEGRENLDTAKAQVGQAQAALERARSAQETDDSGVDPIVLAKQAALEEAELNLSDTVLRAPTDGYMTQLAVRPGMMAVPLPLRPLGVFLHQQEGVFTAAFRQQSLIRIEKGADAELIFDALPGKVFEATVIEVLPAIAESQITPSDRLRGTEAFTQMGNRALVTLRLKDGQELPPLPLGVSAQAAVYSHHFHHLSILRKILLRMLSWQHYLYVDH
uniref:HlyD family secretion protein n=1 Tax=Halomonas sp. TaxID=1486246 RepID=UPI002607CA86|nr:HlyD family secretion protein [Halomonas sp.]